jgi:hypothetical protein
VSRSVVKVCKRTLSSACACMFKVLRLTEVHFARIGRAGA